MSKNSKNVAQSPNKTLMSKVVRIGAADFDAVISRLRLNDDNKRRARSVLVDGRVMRELAKEEGCSAELISSVVRRVRAQLNTRLGTWSFVTVPLTLPLGLAEELRGLVDGLIEMQDEAKAEVILKGVQKAVVLAKAQMLDT